MSSENQRNAPPIDPDIGMLNASCLDLMFIEMVPMAQRISEQLLDPTGSSTAVVPQPKTKSNAQATSKVDPEELREATFYRLESVGFRVGMGIVESLSQNAPLPSTLITTATSSVAPDPSTHLDTIKFLCKDLWMAVFRKQIDNLKTNHRGTFVLTDNRFEPLRRCSLEAGKNEEAKARATPFLWFPGGLVRGALSGLGLDATVTAEVGPVGLPVAVFTLRIGGAKV